MPGLHVIDDGAPAPGSPLVVIVHGTLDRAATFARTSRRLRDAGAHVVRYDRRGYGRSIGLGPGPIGRHVDDLIAVIDGRPAVVFGHSIGGVAGLAAAEREPAAVRAVVAYEPPMPWVSWWPSRTAGAAAVSSPDGGAPADPGDAAEAFMRRMVGDERWERLPARTQAERRSEGPALLAELASLRGVPAPYDPARIGCPVIAVHGSRSEPHQRRAAEALAAAVADARLVVIDGATHGAHLTHATDLAGVVTGVVAGVVADGDGTGQ